MSNYTIKNVSTRLFAIGGNPLEPAKSLSVDLLGTKDYEQVSAGRATLTINTADAIGAALSNAPTVTSTTGTPVAISNKAVTLGAISDVATAANAIATLAGVVNALAADNRRLAASVAALQQVLLENHQAKN